jgi:hypothetical protein
MSFIRKVVMATMGTIFVVGTFVFVSVPYTLGYIPGSTQSDSRSA